MLNKRPRNTFSYFIGLPLYTVWKIKESTNGSNNHNEFKLSPELKASTDVLDLNTHSQCLLELKYADYEMDQSHMDVTVVSLATILYNDNFE